MSEGGKYVFCDTDPNSTFGLTWKVYYRFRKEFGRVGRDFCYDSGALSYARLADDITYLVSFLGEDEIRRLILLSLETGVDHLYEACKDHPLPPPRSDVYY